MVKSINQILQEAVNAHQNKKLEEAEHLYLSILEEHPEHINANNNLGVLLDELGKFEQAGKYLRKSIELKPDQAEAHNNLGNLLSKLDKTGLAIASYRKAIELNPVYVKAQNALANELQKLNKFEEAEVNYKKAIDINPNYDEAYNSWGTLLFECNKLDEAIEKYLQALIINPKHANAKTNIITILNYVVPNKKITHPIIEANRNLQNIKNNFTLENKIQENELAIFFKNCNKVIKNTNEKLTSDLSQIYRRNSINLGCERHKQIFADLNIIAKACFNCFKIQVEPKNVLELFKLFFIFDKLVLPKNNSRKCMVETRAKVSGTYKGIIYCSSIEETNEILEIISPIINNLIECKIVIKRGCVEYTESYPDYLETDSSNPNFMKYKNEWQEKEISFDTKKNIRLKNHYNSLNGISVSDVLIMNNWLKYADKIDDQSYQNIDKDVIIFNKVSFDVLEKQLVKRKKEFLSALNTFK